MMNQDYINELLRRYDEALTTDQEERELAEFFRSTHDIPDEWADYATLFKTLDSAETLFSDEELGEFPVRKPQAANHRKIWRWAAVVVALIAAGASLIPLSRFTKENAELIAEIEPKTTEIKPEMASEGSISTKKSAESPISSQKTTEKPKKSISIQKWVVQADRHAEKAQTSAAVKNEVVEVSGNVVSAEDGEPVYGAIIRVKGSEIGTMTDNNGNFKLKVPKDRELQISYVGMDPIEVAARPQMRLALAPDLKALDEVIVTGYGKQAKSEQTGSIRIRGTSSTSSDNGILVLVNGKEVRDISSEMLKNGTDKNFDEYLQRQNLRLVRINVFKNDAAVEKYRKKFGDWVNAVVEIIAVPIDPKEENQPDSLNS